LLTAASFHKSSMLEGKQWTLFFVGVTSNICVWLYLIISS
jgi:hypothetical protein